MLDCLLIHPGGVHGINPVYGELSKSLTAIEQPLWCRLIAGYLIDKGWDVEIIDQEAEQASARDIAEIVGMCAPKIIAIVVSGHQPSASTQSMVIAREVAIAIRSFNYQDWYKPVVVMMGNHVSALPERTLREEPVDYVIDGEGPVALDYLLRGYSLIEIPGLIWKWSESTGININYEWLQDGGLIHNKPAPLIPINELHGNAWHLLPPPSNYRAHAWQCLDGSPRTPYAAIYTSLGCPYTCSFCMINVFQHTNKYRMRDPEEVVSEITQLYMMGVTTFKIIDELFVLNRNHYRAICEGLANTPFAKELNIWAYARTDTIDILDLPIIRDAGIKWLALGIESGSKAIRDIARKKMKYDDDKNQDITFVVNEINKNDINIIGNYIFGLPEDTHGTMQDTLNLALELKTEWANFYCAMPYPGSALYDQISKERPDDLPPSWAAYSQHNSQCYPLRNDNLTAAEILRFRDEAFITYFTHLPYLGKILYKFGQRGLDHIDSMLSYKLERDLLK